MEDMQLVEAFFSQMGGETRAFFNLNNFNRNDAMRFFQENDQKNKRWMMLDKDLMIGYVFLREIDKRIVWLGVAVADSYKGRHLAGKLMQTAYEYCMLQNKGGILLTTHVANIRGQALYERCGYERIGMHNNGEILYMLNIKC